MSKAKETPISKIVTMTHEEACNDANSWNFVQRRQFLELLRLVLGDARALKAKSKSLLGTLRGIVKTGTKLFDPEKTYVFFKNNSPCAGGLYDDLRICDIESGKVLYSVCPKNPWYGYRPVVAFSAEDADRWKNPLVFESMKDMREWFREPAAFKVSVSKEHIRTGKYDVHTTEVHLCTKAV
jgi:hypothetical protein